MKVIQLKDRLPKQPTKAQREQLESERLLKMELQNAYRKGVSHGSHMQCSTILRVYKDRLNNTPKSKQTKDFLVTTLNDIFAFCEKGLSSEMQAILETRDNEQKE